MYTEPLTFIFELPELVDLNTYINAERRNKFLGAKIKKQMTELVYWELKKEHAPKMTRIDSWELCWYHKNKRKDFDNVEFGVKWIKDGMVMAGCIPNDGWEHFPPRTLHQHRLAKEYKTDPGVAVCIRYV